MRVALPILAAIVGAALIACDGTDHTPTALRPSDSLRSTIDSIALAERIPGVVVAVRTADGRSLDITRGVASLATRTPITAEYRFRVASVTKAMIATIVLQLVDEGSLSLDAPLASHLPGIVPAADRITVRQLLNHTAGLPDYTNDEQFIESIFADPGRTWTPRELIAIANRGAPSFDPGEPGAFAYSNTDYIVLGLLIERITNRSISQALQTRIFDRLGMPNSSYSDSPTLPSPYAEGYADVDDARRDMAVGTLVSPTWGGAAGAVVSTAGDLARFADALAAGTLLRSATHALRTRIAPGSEIRFPRDAFFSGYGLGVIAGGGWVGHNGAIPGYEAEMYAKPGVGTVVVLINRTTDTGASRAIFATVRDAYFGAP